MTGARFEISVDGTSRSNRDCKEIAQAGEWGLICFSSLYSDGDENLLTV
jgi:hypothetical protein